MFRLSGLPGRTGVIMALVLVAGLLGACSTPQAPERLTLTTGSAGAVYDQLGRALSTAWAPGLGAAPAVHTSAGSGENLERLVSGRADAGFSAADAAALRSRQPGGEHLRALARMHDDYVQVVVPANSPVEKLADLRGRRVSVGVADSGVRTVADRLLAAAGVPGEGVERHQLTVAQSADALARGDIDAFFWSGGLPTEQISALAHQTPIRLIGLSDVLPTVLREHGEYDTATLPASTYQLARPATTLLVRNFLLVDDRMPPARAEELTRELFHAAPALAAANRAAGAVDVHSGIETMPIPLHPGAVDYYRSTTM